MTVITFKSCRLTAAHIILVNCSVLLLEFCDAAALILSTVFYLLKQVSLSFDGPTTPLLRVCSNRPCEWTDHITTWVPLHDLASRGPSAPNRTDRRTNTGLSHNIYRARIASRDKNLVYLFVGHLRVNLKVLPSNFFYVFGIPCLATDLCLTPNNIFLGPLEVISIPWNGRPSEWPTQTAHTHTKPMLRTEYSSQSQSICQFIFGKLIQINLFSKKSDFR